MSLIKLVELPSRLYLVAIAICFLAAYIVSVRYRKGLREIPGPFWASISSVDRLWTAASGSQFQYHIDYHDRWGSVVRIGPRHVSIADPAAVTTIYQINTKFYKSPFYKVWDAKTPYGSVPTSFSVRDEDVHRQIRRPVGSAFALSSILEYEYLADVCTSIFQQKIDKYQDVKVDLGKWLHWYAFDVVSSITFSNRLGFLDEEKDIEGIIGSLEGRQFYNTIIGQAPGLDKFFFGNRLVSKLATYVPSMARLDSSRRIVEFSARQLKQRQNTDDENNKQDLVSRFKTIKDGIKVMSDSELLSHAAGNIFAGSDTTAITLRAFIYYVCKNPRVYDRLTQEIRAADTNGNLSEFVAYQEASQLVYFQACVKEVLRIHPAVGLLLERVVPYGGATVCGVWLPAGTIVGVNPWVLGRNKAIFGQDVDHFRPERWIEVDDATLKLMDKASLAFGAGSRICLGKHIAMMEVTKLIPQMFRHYEIRLSYPDSDWKLFDYWFVRQEGLICQLTRRSQPKDRAQV